MDILTSEIREILSRIRDLEDIRIYYSAGTDIGQCVRQNQKELEDLLDTKLEEVCRQQLKYESEMKKLEESMELFGGSDV